MPDAMTWNPPFGANNDWGTAGNWKNNTTGGVAAAAPTITDDVTFDGGTSKVGCVLLNGNAAARSLTILPAYQQVQGVAGSGTLNLNGKTLTVDAGGMMAGTPAGWLSGGVIDGGTFTLARGTLNEVSTAFGASVNVNIGPVGTANAAMLNVVGGSFNASGTTPQAITVASGGNLTVQASSVTIGDTINVSTGGYAILTSSAAITLNNGARINVAAGATLDLESPLVQTQQPLTSYIDNFGTVQKTGLGTTDVQMGIINEDPVNSWLILNGGAGAQLKFENKAPGGTTASVWQKNGQTQIYDGNTLYAASGYQQDAGTLSAMGSWLGMPSMAKLYGSSINTAAAINGGSVILGDGTVAQQSTLDSNLFFQFAANSKLRFGINPNNTAMTDLLITASQVQIANGARAVLDTNNLNGNPPVNKTWSFLRSTAGGNNQITGTFNFTLFGVPLTPGFDLTGDIYQLNS